MHGLTSLAALSLLSPLVLAASEFKHGYRSVMVPRQNFDEYEHDSNGNIEVRLSNNLVNFGHRGAKDILDWLKDEECSDVACNDANNYINTDIVSDRWELHAKEIWGTANGVFNGNNDASRDNLFAVAHAAMNAVVDEKEWPYLDGVCRVPSLCEGSAENTGNINQEFWYPDEVHIVHTNANNLLLDFSVDSSNEEGFCDALDSVGGDVAGAVGGAVSGGGGPLFSLISLGCSVAGN